MASLGFASIVMVVCHAVSAEGHCQLQPSLELYPWGKFLTGTPHQPESNVPLGSSNLAHQALILHMMKQSSYEVIRITQTIYWKAQYDQPWNIHHVQWAFHLPWTLSLAKCIPQSIEADPRIYNWRYSSTRIYGFLMPFNYFQNFRMMHLEKRVYIITYNYILYVSFFDHGNFLHGAFSLQVRDRASQQVKWLGWAAGPEQINNRTTLGMMLLECSWLAQCGCAL